VSNILSEGDGQERAVLAVDIFVQQLRCHVRLKLSTSSLSLSLRLGLRLSLGMMLRLGLSLSVAHSCSCIQKIKYRIKKYRYVIFYNLYMR
jgi:hypothetical protein